MSKACSAAEQAGFAAGDEWIGLQADVGQGRPTTGWRLNKLDDLPLYLGPAKTLQALVARDQRLITLRLGLPDDVQQIKLSARDSTRIDAWLRPATR